MKMNISILVFLSGFIGFSAAAESFNGIWAGEKKTDAGAALSSLTLKMSQDGQKIKGSYCYVSQGGTRIDCPDAGIENLHGTIEGSSAIVSFDSSHEGKPGKARLALNDDKMSWSLIEKPQSAEAHTPLNYSLDKVSEDGVKGTVKTFSTGKFTISIKNHCGDFYTSCNDMFYLGVRNNDNSVITLKGTTTLDSTTKKVNGAVFKNGNVSYQVLYASPELVITQGDKILMKQKGKWVN